MMNDENLATDYTDFHRFLRNLFCVFCVFCGLLFLWEKGNRPKKVVMQKGADEKINPKKFRELLPNLFSKKMNQKNTSP
jgi:hypothetical protein